MKSALPSSMQSIAKIIGEDAAFAMVKEFGGQNLFVPAKIDLGHRLVTAIGLEPARKLALQLPGETLKIPACTTMIRSRAVLEGLRAGEKLLDVARRLGISPRTVQRIAKTRTLISIV